MDIAKVTKANFDEEIKNSKTPVLVDFWATWCGPCQMQGPVLEEIAKERDDIKIAKINIDEEQQLAMEFGITSIPTMMLFRDGKPQQTLVGLRSKAQLAKELGL